MKHLLVAALLPFFLVACSDGGGSSSDPDSPLPLSDGADPANDGNDVSDAPSDMPDSTDGQPAPVDPEPLPNEETPVVGGTAGDDDDPALVNMPVDAPEDTDGESDAPSEEEVTGGDEIPSDDEAPGDEGSAGDGDAAGGDDASDEGDTAGGDGAADDEEVADAGDGSTGDEATGGDDASEGEDTTGDDDSTVDDDFDRVPRLLLGYADTQALDTIRTINDRMFTGTLTASEQACIDMEPAMGEPVLDAVCDPAYPIRDGLLSQASVVSLDIEQGREDDNAACRTSLMNRTTALCRTSVVFLTYEPIDVMYEFVAQGLDDPNITVSRASDSLECFVSYEFGSFDPVGSPCFDLVEEFADSIEARTNASTLALLSRRGERLITRARLNAARSRQ